ncbi:hypothetical protein C1H46_023434 [Malus baccata]|uniref:Uncharacterized protein n=1 Tax=Malus baccata TaxID=106549 RepID=A0A540LX85_MALBA|nr:hypothetical protein C1H46_023434 [Malus baccata]
MHARHQASEIAYEAKITRYIDLATIEEIKAMDYREGFEKARNELRLERSSIFAKRWIRGITSALRIINNLLTSIALRYLHSAKIIRDEISDLEVEQEEHDLEGNPTPDAPGESCATSMGKRCPKRVSLV